MSYINKRGKTTATRIMIIRQQVSDAIAYHQLKTTLVKAKETQKRLERLITLSKKDTIANRRLASRWFVNTQKMNANELVKYLFDVVGPVFKSRNGGYTRVLKMDKRQGDATEIAILQFVDTIPAYKKQKITKKKSLIKDNNNLPIKSNASLPIETKNKSNKKIGK